MAKKGQKLTGKALAAARRNIKKAQAARRGSNPASAKKKNKGGSYQRRSSGPIGGGVRAIREVTTPAANAAMAYGVANVPLTVVTGRNLMHPMGGLNTDDAHLNTVASPYGDGTSLRPMQDVIGHQINPEAFGLTGKPRGKMLADDLAYNLRGAFRENGAATTWMPLGVGIGAAMADRLIMPALERLGDSIDSATAGITGAR